MRATVLVRPKPGILDPQGQAVESSLRHLGFAVAEARVGKLVELEVDHTADPCLLDGEAELLQRALHSLTLGVENAGFRADEHRRPHASTASVRAT